MTNSTGEHEGKAALMRILSNYAPGSNPFSVEMIGPDFAAIASYVSTLEAQVAALTEPDRETGIRMEQVFLEKQRDWNLSFSEILGFTLAAMHPKEPTDEG